MKVDEIARERIEAWNCHDLDRIMSHDDEGWAMLSPFIRTVAGEPSGTLSGRVAWYAMVGIGAAATLLQWPVNDTPRRSAAKPAPA